MPIFKSKLVAVLLSGKCKFFGFVSKHFVRVLDGSCPPPRRKASEREGSAAA